MSLDDESALQDNCAVCGKGGPCRRTRGPLQKEFVDHTDASVSSCSALQRERVRNGSVLDAAIMGSMAAACGFNSQTLARTLGVSPRHLHRLFVASFGCSPQRWLREQQLQLAHRTLVAGGAHGSTMVKEVAFRIGYQHPAQFSRDFRNRFGCSPLDAMAKGCTPDQCHAAPGDIPSDDRSPKRLSIGSSSRPATLGAPSAPTRH
jgi:AraC-like DNA-binding protein